MLMIRRAIACAFLFLAPYTYGQTSLVDLRGSDFDSKGVCLTETLLKLSQQQHFPIAVEYLDRASMNQPIDVSLRNVTIGQALGSALRNGNGYSWRLDGIIQITNSHALKRADILLSNVTAVFRIPEGQTIAMTSAMLWWKLQIDLDPSLKN
jgi:hypothetical protein